VTAGAESDVVRVSAPPPALPLICYADKGKTLGLLFLCGALLVGLVVWAVFARTRTQAVLVVTIAVVAGVPIGFNLSQLVGRVPVFSADESGLTIHAWPRIPWAEITGFSVTRLYVGGVQESCCVLVRLKDVGRFRASQSLYWRAYNVLNGPTLGSPAIISAHWLDIEPETLRSWLDDYRWRYS
jgi:hypothetical protein